MVTLTVLQTLVRYFVEVPLLEFVWCFISWLNWGCELSGGISQRENAILITSYQGYILSIRFITIDVDLDHLAKVVFVRLPNWKVTLSATPTLSILYTLERSQYMQPTPRSGGLCFSISRVVSTSMNCVNDLYQWTLLCWRFVSSPPGLTCSRVILSTTSLPDSIKMSGSESTAPPPSASPPPPPPDPCNMLSYPPL